MRIVALDAAALRLGLAPGLTLADARARVPELAAVDHDPHGDRLWLERIADGCDRWTPMVALDPPDGVTLDITGCVESIALHKKPVRPERVEGPSFSCTVQEEGQGPSTPPAASLRTGFDRLSPNGVLVARAEG
jgi:hypothetical protein